MMRRQGERGITYLELVATAGILMVLASAILPMARATQTRAKEIELRHALRELRNAIDEYKARCDPSIPVGDGKKLAASVGVGQCPEPYYPKKLEDLTEGVQIAGDVNLKKMKFLRRIPIDPMTGTAEWGLRCMRDAADSTGWCGEDIWDVYSKSPHTALDGKTKYRDF
jgi:general secretion pathway protein G